MPGCSIQGAPTWLAYELGFIVTCGNFYWVFNMMRGWCILKTKKNAYDEMKAELFFIAIDDSGPSAWADSWGSCSSALSGGSRCIIYDSMLP